jgi:hypothetical protein
MYCSTNLTEKQRQVIEKIADCKKRFSRIPNNSQRLLIALFFVPLRHKNQIVIVLL